MCFFGSLLHTVTDEQLDADEAKDAVDTTYQQIDDFLINYGGSLE
jgi:hypothetical protein